MSLWNQENTQRQNYTARSTICHPSHETNQAPYKPAIKVGYRYEHETQQTRRYKKPVMIVQHPSREKGGLKRVLANANQVSSGAFLGCEYVPKDCDKRGERAFQRRGVNEVQQQVYAGRSIDKELKQQFLVRSRSAFLGGNSGRQGPKDKGPSLNESGGRRMWGHNKSEMKQLLQYKHAGQFREGSMANKCTAESIKNRYLRFGELHEYDFRKCKPLLR